MGKALTFVQRGLFRFPPTLPPLSGSLASSLTHIHFAAVGTLAASPRKEKMRPQAAAGCETERKAPPPLPILPQSSLSLLLHIDSPSSL